MTTLTISGASTAMFATWFFVEELRLLFDAGDGVCAGLTQKAAKVQNVFVSHSHRDHLTGLVQLNQLATTLGAVTIHYPADCGSFPALRAFCERFDPQAPGSHWLPIAAGDVITVKGGLQVTAHRSEHVDAPAGVHKCFGYTVHRANKKLKPEYVGLPGTEIRDLRAALGDDAVTETHLAPVMAYAGDTPGTPQPHWQGMPVLIHEATFIDPADMTEVSHKHSCLADVMQIAMDAAVGSLILSHFSCRYSPEQIDAAIREECDRHRPAFPIYRVLPGRVHYDILSQPPIWAGADG